MSEQLLSSIASGIVGGLIGAIVVQVWRALPIERPSNGENIADIMREMNEAHRIENETWKTTTYR